jgi:hypothetical protein
VSRRLHILPDGLKWGDISWEPTWEEKALDWNRQQIALALAAVKRIELEEQPEASYYPAAHQLQSLYPCVISFNVLTSLRGTCLHFLKYALIEDFLVPSHQCFGLCLLPLRYVDPLLILALHLIHLLKI